MLSIPLDNIFGFAKIQVYETHKTKHQNNQSIGSRVSNNAQRQEKQKGNQSHCFDAVGQGQKLEIKRSEAN